MKFWGHIKIKVELYDPVGDMVEENLRAMINLRDKKDRKVILSERVLKMLADSINEVLIIYQNKAKPLESKEEE